MTGQGATLPNMTTPDVTDWRKRLAARGIQPAADVPDGETDEDRAERLRVQSENRARRWTSRLPATFAEASLNALDDEQHPAEIRQWLTTTSPTLLLAGTVGSGKTHTAYAVGHEGIRRGLHVEATTTYDLLHALRPDGDVSLASGARFCDLLVLDDLGVGKVTDFAVDEITHLIGARVAEGKRQVITTNHTAESLREMWGARLVSRLTDGACILVFRGADRRVAW